MKMIKNDVKIIHKLNRIFKSYVERKTVRSANENCVRMMHLKKCL